MSNIETNGAPSPALTHLMIEIDENQRITPAAVALLRRYTLAASYLKETPRTGELYKALAVAQGKFTNPKANKTAKKKFTNRRTQEVTEVEYKYATLDEVIAMIRGPLSEAGICWMQPLQYVGDKQYLVTKLVFGAAEQSVETSMLLPTLEELGNDPQALASMTTQLKRYLLCSMLGIAADVDDDATKAMERINARREKAEARAPSRTEGVVWPAMPEVSSSFHEDIMRQVHKLSFHCGTMDRAEELLEYWNRQLADIHKARVRDPALTAYLADELRCALTVPLKRVLTGLLTEAIRASTPEAVNLLEDRMQSGACAEHLVSLGRAFPKCAELVERAVRAEFARVEGPAKVAEKPVEVDERPVAAAQVRNSVDSSKAGAWTNPAPDPEPEEAASTPQVYTLIDEFGEVLGEWPPVAAAETFVTRWRKSGEDAREALVEANADTLRELYDADPQAADILGELEPPPPDIVVPLVVNDQNNVHIAGYVSALTASLKSIDRHQIVAWQAANQPIYEKQGLAVMGRAIERLNRRRAELGLPESEKLDLGGGNV